MSFCLCSPVGSSANWRSTDSPEDSSAARAATTPIIARRPLTSSGAGPTGGGRAVWEQSPSAFEPMTAPVDSHGAATGGGWLATVHCCRSPWRFVRGCASTEKSPTHQRRPSARPGTGTTRRQSQRRREPACGGRRWLRRQCTAADGGGRGECVSARQAAVDSSYPVHLPRLCLARKSVWCLGKLLVRLWMAVVGGSVPAPDRRAGWMAEPHAARRQRQPAQPVAVPSTQATCPTHLLLAVRLAGEEDGAWLGGVDLDGVRLLGGRAHSHGRASAALDGARRAQAGGGGAGGHGERHCWFVWWGTSCGMLGRRL